MFYKYRLSRFYETPSNMSKPEPGSFISTKKMNALLAPASPQKIKEAIKNARDGFIWGVERATNDDPSIINELLLDAFYGGYMNIVQLLIQNGVDLHYSSSDGTTAFLQACKGGHLSLVKLLLNRGSDLYHQTTSGWNGLMYACHTGNNIHLVSFLLENGLDPCSRNLTYTAIGLATSGGFYDICMLLISKGANLMEPTHGNSSALYRYRYLQNPSRTITVIDIRHKQSLLEQAFARGPHSSQINNPENRWRRRCSVMMLMSGCCFKPLPIEKSNWKNKGGTICYKMILV